MGSLLVQVMLEFRARVKRKKGDIPSFCKKVFGKC